MIILFCGIPGSGKTTIAKKLAAQLKKRGSVRLFISDKLKPPVYKKFFRLLKENAGEYDYLIFDATFYRKKWRDNMVALSCRIAPLLTVYVKCSLATALKRNRRRRPKIPEKAVHIIYHRFEPPKWPDAVIDTENLTLAQAVKVILALLNSNNGLY